MASLALASLTETYTDSEGEEVSNKDEDVVIEASPVLVKEQTLPKYKMPTRLVSYHPQDDIVVSDDDTHYETNTSNNTSTEPNLSVSSNTSLSAQFIDVEMPPEPAGSCPAELADKIIEMTRKMQEKGYDMNLIIQQRKSFRNPSIYEKLIDYCNINEFGTNYEPQIYDPLKWDKTSYYDELAKLQKSDMEQREKERRERTKIEFLTGTARKVTNGTSTEDDPKKRKSKWDQVVYPQNGPRLQSGVTTLTSAATGTKGIVISAFGSLPKKPKN